MRCSRRSGAIGSVSTPQQQPTAFRAALVQFVADLNLGGQGFSPVLQGQAVQGHPRVWEMTWAPDGRATFEYGNEVLAGEPHVIWRRIGTHSIFPAAESRQPSRGSTPPGKRLGSRWRCQFVHLRQ